MASQFFKKVFISIFESQKSYRVQTSVHLKKIDQYLFDKAAPKLDNDDIEIMYLGIPDKKIMGLYGLAGVAGTVSGLKKSAYYALQLIYKTITNGKNREVCMKYFSESDQEDFRLLRLATHISEDKSKTALQLCALVKDKRPYLSQNNYIYSQESKEKFKKWYKQRPKPRKQQIKKKADPLKIEQSQATHVQAEHINQFKQTHQQNFMKNNAPQDISTNLKDLQFLDFQIMGSEQQYFVDTFLDPLDICEYKSTIDTTRQKIMFQQYMMYLIQTPISRVSPSKISQRIFSIHLESPEFTPAILVEKYHKNLNENDRHELGKEIPHHIGIDTQKNLVKYFFVDFLRVEAGLGKIKENFDQKEKIRNEANIGFSLRTKTKNSVKHLSSKVQPLEYKHSECEKLRKLIVFLQQNTEFTHLSTTIRSLIEQQKIDQIPRLFSKYQDLINIYREQPILRILIQNIESHMQQARIKQIQIALNQGIKKDEVEILLGLFSDKKKILKDYIVPKMVFIVLSKMRIKEKDLLHRLQNKIKQFELVNFQELVVIKNTKILGEDISDEGDLLELFLQQKQTTLDSYEAECHKFQNEIEAEFLILGELLQQLKIKYNVFLQQQDLVNKIMIDWCNYITGEVKKSVDAVYFDKNYSNKRSSILQEEKCMELICRILLGIQKFIEDRGLLQKMEALNMNNFQLFCKLLVIESKATLDFKPSPIKRDFDKNYYNDVLVSMIEQNIEGTEKIKKYPSFANATHPKYKEQLFNFISDGFEIDDTLLGNLPEILTYACIVNAIIEDHFLVPFYNELQKFNNLRQYLRDKAKTKSRRIKQLLNTYIKIQYISIITQHKYEKFALEVLELLNGHLFLISEYAFNNYKNLSRFFLESFLNECEKFKHENVKQSYFVEMYMIKGLTTKITSKRIEERWTHILNGGNFQKTEVKNIEDEISKLKYKNSITFKALIQ